MHHLNRLSSKLKIFTILLAIFIILLLSILITSAKNVPSNQIILKNTPKTQVDAWKNDIYTLGPEQAYQKFKDTNIDDKDAHFEVHMFGKLLYEHMGKRAITVCDTSFFYGCFHGVFTGAVLAEGTDVIYDLEKSCIEKFGFKDLACRHGIGHGLMEYFGTKRLNLALDMCDSLQLNLIGGCFSGVFMEFNSPVQSDGEEIEMSVRSLDPDRPNYPCDTVKEKYRQNCYFDQAKWWDPVLGRDRKKVGEFCSRIPDEVDVKYCYLGLGTRIAKEGENKVSEIIDTCSQMPNTSGEIYCRVGGAFTINADGGTHDVTSLCQGLTQSDRENCLHLLKSNILNS